MGNTSALDRLREEFFLKPDGSNLEVLFDLVRMAVQSLIDHQGNGPVYPVNQGVPSPTVIAGSSSIPQEVTPDPIQGLQELYSRVQQSQKAGHPFYLKNILPTPSLAGLVVNLAVSLYMPNGASEEDAGQALLAELACAGALARLAGLDPDKAAGLFTFGGTGTNLYAIKMGLAKALPNHGMSGLDGNVTVVGSLPGHYCHQTAANWLGIGQSNYIRVASNLDQTTKLDELEDTCANLLSDNKRIACIIASGGTTSNMGIDDIAAISEIRRKLVERFNLPYMPHIHADAVVGWAYMNFFSYDFARNHLGFSEAALLQIKKVIDRLQTIRYADSFGVDLHKTGYMHYPSSLIVVKDRMDLMRLQRDVDIMTPIFQDDKAYNPGRYTLETSRSAANMVAAWTVLETLGQEGYQALLGHAIEMGLEVRTQLKSPHPSGLYVVNQEPFGPDVFIRCYKSGSDIDEIYRQELNDDNLLASNSAYTSKFAFWLYSNKTSGDDGFSISRSSAAFYTHTGHPVVALRVYPLSPYISKETIGVFVSKLTQAKKEFDRELQLE